MFFSVISDEDPGEFLRFYGWRDVREEDMKIFLAHLITLGLVQKGNLEKYWDHGEAVKTPFFGMYIGRNTFQSILSNFQMSNKDLDVPRDHPHHDPLFKVGPMIDMMDRTFVQSYKCDRDLSFNEGCCPYNGKVYFYCYNPSKPSKWHIKLFEVSDARTGYVIGFDVYTGKNKTKCLLNANVLDPDSTQTTKVVVGLLLKCNLLGKGHHVYMDNYYLSLDLFWELHCKEVFATGTCRSNRKNLPKAVTQAKLKRSGECVFRRDKPLLCLKWHKKKDVTMRITIHEAVFVETEKVDREGNKIEKPEAVFYHCS